eukprot:gene12799-15020_t
MSGRRGLRKSISEATYEAPPRTKKGAHPVRTTLYEKIEKTVESSRRSWVDPEVDNDESEPRADERPRYNIMAAFAKRPEDLVRLYINHDVYERNKSELRDIVKFFSEGKMPYRLFDAGDGQMEKVSGSGHSEGICVVARLKTQPTPEDAFSRMLAKTTGQRVLTPPVGHSNLRQRGEKKSANSVRPIAVLLDNVENPTNIGAIIRACASFDVDTVFAYNDVGRSTSGRVNPLSTASYRASRGAMEHVDVVVMDERAGVINLVKEFKVEGWEVVAATSSRGESTVPLFSDRSHKVLGTRPLLLVFGNESDGISKGLVKLAGTTIVIPGSGLIDCLNVSQALSIVLAECWRIQGKSLEDANAPPSTKDIQVAGTKIHSSVLEVTPELLGITTEQVYRDEDGQDDDEDLEQDLQDFDEMNASKNMKK